MTPYQLITLSRNAASTVAGCRPSVLPPYPGPYKHDEYSLNSLQHTFKKSRIMVLHGVLCGLMLQGHTAGLFCPYAAGLRFLSAEHGETKILTQGLRLMIKYLECLLRGQNSSSWVPCCPKAGVERECASESVWILKSAVNSVCLRPQDPGRGGDWKCLKFQRGCGTVWGAIPLVEFLAFAFVLPSLFLPSSSTWDLILHEVGICVGFSAMDFSTDAHPSLNGLSADSREQVQGPLISDTAFLDLILKQSQVRPLWHLNQPGGPLPLPISFCDFLGHQALASFGELLLQGADWVDFDLSFCSLQFLYVSFEP